MPTAFDQMVSRQLDYSRQPLTRLTLLRAHLDYAWDLVRPRMDGLTDDEYFWEPAPGCWTVRRRDDDELEADWTSPAPDPPPFTTIAWRMSHIGMIFAMRSDHLFGSRTLTPESIRWPGSADDALRFVDDAFAAYRDGVAGLDEADLDRNPDSTPGTIDGLFPNAMGVQHMTLELIHHGAEVSLLRDLYRARDGST